MTTIVGIQGRSWALLGADSRVTAEGSIYQLPKNQSKIIELEEVTIACAGDVRAINIIQNGLKLRDVSVRSDENFITDLFIPALRKAFTEAGYEKTADGVSSTESEFLVAYNGRIYEIGDDYSWIQDARNIYAIGSGGMYALGSLATMVGDSLTQKEARAWALKALDVASQYNAETAPPYKIVIA